MKPLKKNDSLVIVGRRWFDKINGNTYHSAEIIINGQFIHKTGVCYGYENMYEATASQYLYNEGALINFGHASLRQFCNQKGINYYPTHADVSRKKDL